MENDVRYTKKTKRTFAVIAVVVMFTAITLYVNSANHKGNVKSGSNFACVIFSPMLVAGIILVVNSMVEYVVKPILFRKKVEATIVCVETVKSYDGKNYIPTYEYYYDYKKYRVQSNENKMYAPTEGDTEFLWINPDFPDRIYEKRWGSFFIAVGNIILGVSLAIFSGFFLYNFLI